LTISVDDSLESIRSGSAGIVVSLPKQKNLSYLLKFSNQEGKFISQVYSLPYIRVQMQSVLINFLDRLKPEKVLMIVKLLNSMNEQKNHQLNNIFKFILILHEKQYINMSILVLWLFITATKYDARLYSYINLSTSNS
jgi:hypothetical protein